MSKTELVFEVHRDPDGGYWARAVGESILTEAETLDELEANIRDAVDCHFDEGEAVSAANVTRVIFRNWI